MERRRRREEKETVFRNIASMILIERIWYTSFMAVIKIIEIVKKLVEL